MPDITPTAEQRHDLVWKHTLNDDDRSKIARAVAKGQVPKDVVSEMRRLCQTNLWYLARHVIGNDWLSERVHKPICEFFVQKNPDKPFGQQEDIHERMLLMPRGTLKSTLNVIDTVQWILTFRDIVIIILTAADDLATAFVDEVKNYFVCEQDDNGKWENPTLLQALFPEHCVTDKAKDKGVSGKFTTRLARFSIKSLPS